MAKIYLDTNIFIDLLRRDPSIRNQLDSHEVMVSPLSFHILCYAAKIKLPDGAIDQAIKGLHIVNLTKQTLKRSASGPTKDMEDNIQLHSAASVDCDYFFTNDKELLKMKYFGKMQIVSSMDLL